MYLEERGSVGGQSGGVYCVPASAVAFCGAGTGAVAAVWMFVFAAVGGVGCDVEGCAGRDEEVLGREEPAKDRGLRKFSRDLKEGDCPEIVGDEEEEDAEASMACTGALYDAQQRAFPVKNLVLRAHHEASSALILEEREDCFLTPFRQV